MVYSVAYRGGGGVKGDTCPERHLGGGAEIDLRQKKTKKKTIDQPFVRDHIDVLIVHEMCV